MKGTHVLVVAGSDSSGGAGLSRDIETLAGLGLRACLAVTAVTVQTHGEVLAVEPLPPALVADQMRAALKTNHVGAIKIGMLATEGTIEAVAAVLHEHDGVPAVLDPVLAASSGGALLEEEAIAVLTRDLMPLCRIVTPNWPELAILTGSVLARDEAEVIRQGEILLKSGCQAVLVKGGHAPGGRSPDILLQNRREAVRFDAARVDASLRGTGCMLASGMAAGLAARSTLEDSVRAAKAVVMRALQREARGRARPSNAMHE